MSRDSGFARWALVTSALLLGPAAVALAATITQASPQGEVARVQQVVLSFDEAVIAAGDPRRGTWPWIPPLSIPGRRPPAGRLRRPP